MEVNHSLFWTVDIDFCISMPIAVYFMYDFLLEGSLEIKSGNYYIAVSGNDEDSESNAVAKQSNLVVPSCPR
jgi:hypothetical protein